MPNHHILFIDAYDSFSNNIISLLDKELSVSVTKIRNDDQRFVLNNEAFYDYLDGFDAVVVGPGPGQPAEPSDIGLIASPWSLPDEHLLPVLGICLGFQSLALEFGATVERLQEPRHGIVTPVLHCACDIFEDTAEIVTTQYHSLHVKLGQDVQIREVQDLWRPLRACRELVPLAYDLSDSANGPILMSARHCHLPFWGVQYHPESICTNEQGRKLIKNWWRAACEWRVTQGRGKASSGPGLTVAEKRAPLIDSPFDESCHRAVEWSRLQLPDHVEVVDIVNRLRNTDCAYQPIVLASGVRNSKPLNPETGRFSIIGLHDAQSTHIRYSASTHQLEISANGRMVDTTDSTITDTFTFIERFIQERKAVAGPECVPFWGGLIGFISYEAGLESIEVTPAELGGKPDLWFVFVERSIVIDHVSCLAYVQSIRDDDADWLSQIARSLHEGTVRSVATPSKRESVGRKAVVTSSPKDESYRQKVRQCQDHLRGGSSYELCLTDTTHISSQEDPWSLYTRLHYLNPAPFGAYLRFDGGEPGAHIVSLISSSPERFLSWSRDGNCQFRPIKGTVKKGPGMTRARAEGILGSAKEQAENLMIVDLIRHDLSGVKG